MSDSDHVSATDSAFLDLERPGLPMHVAALLLVRGDPPVTIKEAHDLLASRISRLPRFMQIPRAGRWVRVRRIDLSRHLFHHVLPAPGHMSHLVELCAHIHEQALERDRPLWQLHLIDGVPGGRQAVMLKTHHAVTDGIAGVEVAEVLFDREPGASPAIDRPVTTFAGRPRASALGVLQGLFGVAATAAGGPIAPDGPFNGPVGPLRSFATCEIPLAVVKDAKHRFGGTVDDVVVAIVAAGLRRYLWDAHYPDPPHALRAMLPVSTCAGRPGGLGNHVSAIFLDLPMDVEGMASLVHAVSAAKSVLRTAHAATGAEMIVRATGLLPSPIHSLVMKVAMDLRSSNLVLSDVPAPDAPMFIAGRRITGSFPMMPLGADIGLSIAVLGMAGKLGVGITADPELVPNVRRIAGAIEGVVDELGRELRRHPHRAAA